MRKCAMGLVAVVAAGLFLGDGLLGQEKRAEKPSDNLLQNGSFEEGVEPEFEGNKHKPLDEDSTEVKGWIVTRGQIDYVGVTFKAADGNRSLDLHGSPGFGGVKQTFTTREGQKYRVTLSLACSPARMEKSVRVGVRAAGKKTAFAIEGPGDGTAENPGWVTKTWEFVAIADHTSLEIHALDTTEPFCGPLVDTVSVVVAVGE